MPGAAGRLSVVIPVGPGDAVSPELQRQLRALPARAEVIVMQVDQASPRPTSSTKKRGPQWRSFSAAAGRAAQQNAGAALATREFLWFLHADSRLAVNTLDAVARFIDRDERALAYCDLRFLDDGPGLMWLNTAGAYLRSRWLRLPFGDQGLLLARRDFIALGGFDERIAWGEDHALVWRARRAGLPLRALGAPLYTSARKYARAGWLRTTCQHLAATARQARRFSRASAT